MEVDRSGFSSESRTISIDKPFLLHVKKGFYTIKYKKIMQDSIRETKGIAIKT